MATSSAWMRKPGKRRAIAAAAVNGMGQGDIWACACGAAPAPGRSLCAPCEKKRQRAAREAARRKAYREAGVCLACRRAPCVPDTGHCAECRDRLNAEARGRSARKKEAGICQWCDAPVEEGKTLCRPHLDAASVAQKALMRSRRKRGRCGACGGSCSADALYCRACSTLSAARRSKYDLSPADYDRMEAEQGGVCAICGGTQPPKGTRRGGRLYVDHDHTTGAVRGLLCAPCNYALGAFKDSPAVLRSAAAYLDAHAARS